MCITGTAYYQLMIFREYYMYIYKYEIYSIIDICAFAECAAMCGMYFSNKNERLRKSMTMVEQCTYHNPPESNR